MNDSHLLATFKFFSSKLNICISLGMFLVIMRILLLFSSLLSVSFAYLLCHPVNNWRGKQSSIPPHKTRPDSPVRTLQRNCDPSQIWPRGSQERKHEFPASTRDEALFHCTEPSGVPRGPSQLHSIPDFSEAPLDLPEITGTSRGNQGFPAPTRKRPRESFFNAS